MSNIFEQLQKTNMSPKNISAIHDALERRMNDIFQQSIHKMIEFGSETGKLISTIDQSDSDIKIKLAKAIGIDIPEDLESKNDNPKIDELKSKFKLLKEKADEIQNYFGKNVKSLDGRYIDDLSEEESDPSLIDYNSIISCFEATYGDYESFYNNCISIMDSAQECMVEIAKEKLKDREDSEEVLSELINNYSKLKSSANKAFKPLFDKTIEKLKNLQDVKQKIDLIKEIL